MAERLPTTITELLQQVSEQYPERTFLEDDAGTLSFGELVAAAHRAGSACLACGVDPGDRVAIWAPNIREWIIAALGAQLAGAILVPLNTRFKGEEAAYILRRSGAVMLFSVGDFLAIDYMGMLRDEELPELRHRVLLSGEDAGGMASSWDDFLAAGDKPALAKALQQRMADSSGGDILDMMFTSGTTGHPKGVLSTQEQNLRVYHTWGSTVGIHSSDRYLVINPFFHSFGYKAGWLSCLIFGCRILPLTHFDVERVLRTIAERQITLLPGPPTIFQSLLEAPQRRDFDLSSLRLAVTGAASVPVELIRRMREELGFESVLTAYGLTESCGVVSICRSDDEPETVATTSGLAISGVDIRCVDERDRPLPSGEAGELLVRGYNVMQGYYAAPQETAATIDGEGWLHTGDIAVIDARGYLRITDRLKDIFISGGFNCYPAEIENVLCSLPGVARAAVIGMPDQRLGEVAAAFIVRDPAHDCGTAEDVIAVCRERMANYKVPRRVEFVAELPLNAAGKVVKGSLRQSLAESDG